MLRSAVLLLAFALPCVAGAQTSQPPRPPDYGGLASYPVPKEQGGPAEFRTCVTYAKRAWRMGLMAQESQASLAQPKRWASEQLGRDAAAEEIADYDKLEKNAFKSPHQLGAARFIRCAHQLKLHPQMHHGGNAEHCWRVVAPLDIVARARAENKSRDEAGQVLRASRPGIQDKTVASILEVAYNGPTLNEGSGVIEDAFSECFSRAGRK